MVTALNSGGIQASCVTLKARLQRLVPVSPGFAPRTFSLCDFVPLHIIINLSWGYKHMLSPVRPHSESSNLGMVFFAPPTAPFHVSCSMISWASLTAWRLGPKSSVLRECGQVDPHLRSHVASLLPTL